MNLDTGLYGTSYFFMNNIILALTYVKCLHFIPRVLCRVYVAIQVLADFIYVPPLHGDPFAHFRMVTFCTVHLFQAVAAKM